MIVTQLKPLDQIIDKLSGHRTILVAGCGCCTTIYHKGGRPECEELSSKLEEFGFECTIAVVPRQCSKKLVERSLKPMIERCDAILSMGCGVGVQIIVEAFPEKPVLPALDTKFVGRYEFERKEFEQLCALCGNCILAETGGICPIAKCPKGLLNGPCGGQRRGKCEVYRDRDCVWIVIYKRLKALGKLDSLRGFRAP